MQNFIHHLFCTPTKPSFNIIVTIVLIAVKNDFIDLIDPSNLMETYTNDVGDSEDQDGCDRSLLYSTNPLAIATQRSTSYPIVNRWEVSHSHQNNSKDYIEARFNTTILVEGKFNAGDLINLSSTKTLISIT